MTKTLRLLLALVAVVSGVLFAAGANAAGREPVTITCDGSTLTVLTQPSHHDGWGAVQVVGNGTLIPIAFSFTVVDVTKGNLLLFSDSHQKGGGRTPSGLAGSLATCTETQAGLLSEMLEPGEQPPPGTDLTDIITFTLTATVIKVR